MDCNKRDWSNVAIMKARVVARQRIIDPMTNEHVETVCLLTREWRIYRLCRHFERKHVDVF